ncbi:MAG: helix-turn-helix transcriptional regulator [Rhodomicrobium sp.]
MTHTELARLREWLGYSQVKMAEELGITRRGYQFLESGDRNISMTVAKLARLLVDIRKNK